MTGESAPNLTPSLVPLAPLRSFCASPFPYMSLLYNAETKTMMSTEIETRVRGGITSSAASAAEGGMRRVLASERWLYAHADRQTDLDDPQDPSSSVGIGRMQATPAPAQRALQW